MPSFNNNLGYLVFDYNESFYKTKGRARCKNGSKCTHCCPSCCASGYGFQLREDYVGDIYCDKCKAITIHLKDGCLSCYYEKLRLLEKTKYEKDSELSAYENSYKDMEGCDEDFDDANYGVQ